MSQRGYNLNRMSHFIAAVEEGNMTRAAARLGLSKAVISKQLLLLEDEIGVSLLLRNSRHLSMTQAGLAFYEQAKTALDLANEAFEDAAGDAKTPRGTIRVTAPVDYGMIYLANFVARFQAKFPDVFVDIKLSDERIDPMEGRFDISIRVGWLEDSSNIARKIATFHEIAVCAANSPIAKQATHPNDLADTPAIINSAFRRPTKWTFNRGKEKVDIVPKEAIRMNIAPAILNAILSSTSVGVLPDFVVTNEIKNGTIVQVLPDWSLREGGIYAVFPATKFRLYAVRQFTEMLIAFHR